MPDTFELLADPTRRQLVEILRDGDHSVGTLVTRVGVSQPAVSKQLRTLREAGLASVRKDGRRRMYSLNFEAFQELDEWLAPFRAVWETRLDAMEGVLNSMEE
ncbi:MAG: metalloregulator ArsR/SmtB family transcription factor [Gemmatimonadota bacterium]|nr:metalloregulator ArsR/SmtB family transcription factor [Gemmatimonadota bacterium]